MDGKPTKENPIPVLHMGYAVAAATPERRPLIRKSLNFSTEKKPACSTSSSEVDLSSNECVDSESDKFTAKKLDVCDAHQHTDECESTCCTMFNDQCKNRPTMVDSSTQTIDIVELDHNYGYTKKKEEMPLISILFQNLVQKMSPQTLIPGFIQDLT